MVSASSSFLPLQLIYSGKTKRCLPNAVFLIALMLHSLQIIGPIVKSVSACLRKLSFPNLKRKKKNLDTQRNNTL